MKLKETIVEFSHKKNVINLTGIRKRNMPYFSVWILYYAWVITYATWWTSSPVIDSSLDTQIRSIMHIVNLLSSAVFVFIIRKKWFVNIARVSAIIIVLSMTTFYILPSALLKIVTSIVGSVAIGCFNICILIPFVFKLNNTEKLYAVVSSNILIQLISLLHEYNFPSILEPIVYFLLLVCSLSTVLFFRKKDNDEPGDLDHAIKPVMHKRVYISLIFNCAIAILCKGVAKGILNIAAVDLGLSVLTGYYIGGLLGCLVYIFVYTFTKKAYIWLGNIIFSSIAISLLCNVFVSQAPWHAIPFSVLLGLGSTIGMINMYYIIGVIGKKYGSMLYIRLSILFIGVFGGVSGIVVGNLLSRFGTFEASISASLLSAMVMIAFMFVSPIMERADCANDWGLDSGHTEVGGGILALLTPYGLSKRETEVCDLLLQGYTLRQTSALLAIAYSTVNTYCTSAYRKLGINSRTELVLKFKDHITK